MPFARSGPRRRGQVRQISLRVLALGSPCAEVRLEALQSLLGLASYLGEEGRWRVSAHHRSSWPIYIRECIARMPLFYRSFEELDRLELFVRRVQAAIKEPRRRSARRVMQRQLDQIAWIRPRIVVAWMNVGEADERCLHIHWTYQHFDQIFRLREEMLLISCAARELPFSDRSDDETICLVGLLAKVVEFLDRVVYRAEIEQIVSSLRLLSATHPDDRPRAFIEAVLQDLAEGSS